MPTSVTKLFSDVSLSIAGCVRWEQTIPDNRAGVYVVATTSNPNDENNIYSNNPPIDLDILQRWIDSVPTLKMDGARTTSNALKDRLSRFWLPDEPILYIGRTTVPLKDRVKAYYRTPLGAKKPHAGGHWLKTLSTINSLSVYWAASSKPSELENDLLRTFIEGVSPNTRSRLLDSEHPFPFANLEYPQGNRKAHGIRGATK